MDSVLEGIDGTTAIMNDIPSAAPDVETHDTILRKVIERVPSHNLMLNYDKCLVWKPEVPYVKHLLTVNGLKPDPAKVEPIVSVTPPADKEGWGAF